jgi:hypothetical protein
MLPELKKTVRFGVHITRSLLSRNKKRFDHNDRRRIINPPYCCDDSEFVSTPMYDGSHVRCLVATTPHGTYIKPSGRYACNDFENVFGFGPGCIGFSTDTVVYYPSYA